MLVVMKPQSAKAKGRKFQQWVRDQLISVLDISEKDCKSTSMGAGGADVQLSSAAHEKFPYAIECKAQQSISVWAAYKQAQTHGDGEPLLFITRNHGPKLVVVDAEYFIKLHKAFKQ